MQVPPGNRKPPYSGSFEVVHNCLLLQYSLHFRPPILHSGALQIVVQYAEPSSTTLSCCNIPCTSVLRFCPVLNYTAQYPGPTLNYSGGIHTLSQTPQLFTAVIFPELLSSTSLLYCTTRNELAALNYAAGALQKLLRRTPQLFDAIFSPLHYRPLFIL